MPSNQYHLLVIDDEPLHRRGLASLVRELRPAYRVFSARDGLEGLEMVNRNRIDIVLTDIRMAEMDGLEFIGRLGTRVTQSKVIIISAYSRFDYAREALRLGAFDYLLKPVVHDDLERILQKAETALEEDQERRARDAQMLERLQSTTLAYDQQVLNRWLRGELPSEQVESKLSAPIREHFTQLHLSCGGQIGLSKITWETRPVDTETDADGVDSTVSSHQDSSNLRSQILQSVSGAMRQLGSALVFWLEGSQDVLFVLWAIDSFHTNQCSDEKECDGGFEKQYARVARIAGQLIEDAVGIHGAQCTVGIGGPCANIANTLSRGFEEALHALDSAFFATPDTVVLHSEISYSADKPLPISMAFEARLGESIAGLQRDQIQGQLDTLINLFTKGQYPSSHRMKESILYLLVHRTRALESALRIEWASNLIAEMEFRIPECRSVTELRIATLHYLTRLMDAIEERKSSNNHSVLQSCLAHINDNLGDDLALEQVARRFYFSPAYFSTIFKSHTGVTFTEYVLQRRLERAKILLTNDYEKVSTIAQSVGFRDAGYFARVFRRETGLSPDEYRKNSAL